MKEKHIKGQYLEVMQSELKATVKRAVESTSNVRMESSRRLRISQILSQFIVHSTNLLCEKVIAMTRSEVKYKLFENAFEGVSGLYDMGAIKSDKEKPLDSDKIEKNINLLKDKLKKDNTALYQIFGSSQVISNKSKIVENLKTNYKKAFEKIERNMKPPSILRVRGMCEEFISNFINRNYQNLLPEKLTHNKTWKESEEKILDIVKEVFIILEEIWVNPAFNSNLAESLNEGTYQSTVIFLLIRTILKNLPFGLSSFISICERQSIAISDRKGEGKIGRKPDMIIHPIVATTDSMTPRIHPIAATTDSMTPRIHPIMTTTDFTTSRIHSIAATTQAQLASQISSTARTLSEYPEITGLPIRSLTTRTKFSIFTLSTSLKRISQDKQIVVNKKPQIVIEDVVFNIDFEVTLSQIGKNSFWDISFYEKCEDGFYFQWKPSWSASYISVKSATT
ncbi:11566_t:CDS:2 [Dentiscutata heterogama]|uniref:11566_t:CDS:1 n=1 Tax=Dentiscutata heterogama TaxID=1316150 RepID=A0ACA9K233_9GLOM|nr:11566_t:CDS:2 [Dentiscutata heterogama]